MSTMTAVRSQGRAASTAGPTLLLLHGFGSHEHDLAGLGDLASDDLPWASLRAPLTLPGGGHAWFPIVAPGNPEPGPVAAATDAIWGWVDEHLGPDASVVPLGFSQGGLMATQLLRTRPERVRAAVVLGGFVQAAEQVGDPELRTAGPPTFWGRGADDAVIAAHAIARTAQWLPEHTTLVEHVYPGLGHGISAEEIADVRAFLAGVLSSHPGP
jgi:phospholipase/carboxylesterase